MESEEQKKQAAALRARVLRTINDFGMLKAGDKVLVAVSGGPDSQMLLHLMLDLVPAFSLRLGIAHVNHGLRPGAAEKEALDVENLARRHNLPFHLHHAKLHRHSGSLEEKGRLARYAFFDDVAQSHHYTKIALGHHAGDNAEVVLMNLVRGSGTRGLAGIPACREGRIIRPLIDLQRKEILGYLDSLGLDYARDLSNLDRRFERNRVRLDLIPQLQRIYNNNIVATLNRMSALFRDEEQWFAEYLQPLLDQATLAADNRQTVLDIATLHGQHPALQRRLLRMALGNRLGHLRRIGAEHIEALRAMIGPGARSHAVCLPGGVTAVREKDTLIMKSGCTRHKSRPPRQPGDQIQILPSILKDDTFDLPQWGISMHLALAEGGSGALPADERLAVAFDADHVGRPLMVRSVRPGDRIRPFGMRGSKKVKDLFIDLKIPSSRRAGTALLFAGDTLLWVVGVRRSAHAPVTATTRRILRVACTAHCPEDAPPHP
ncbi:MAG: tRNA lysidine(34) synthetase TilS [Desulfosarcinaceae bacterium]